jgi:hypothetical protein
MRMKYLQPAAGILPVAQFGTDARRGQSRAVKLGQVPGGVRALLPGADFLLFASYVR